MLLYFLLYSILVGVSVGHLAFIAHKTDFIAEYGKLLKLTNILNLEAYESWRKIKGNEDCHYPVFLRETKNSFVSRLIGCPYCLITFLSLLLTLPLAFVTATLGTLTFQIETKLYKEINKDS